MELFQKEKTILPEVFMYFFKLILIQNLDQTEIFAPKLISNLALTQTLILILKKVNEKWKDKYSSFLFCSFQVRKCP